ncbi:hypothetical protein V8F33_010669 [Rhypophila sp. PSN 637]
MVLVTERSVGDVTAHVKCMPFAGTCGFNESAAAKCLDRRARYKLQHVWHLGNCDFLELGGSCPLTLLKRDGKGPKLDYLLIQDAFPILLSVFSSLWGVSSASPGPETTLNGNVAAPAATPPPWKDKVIAHIPIPNILDPAVSTPPNTFTVHPTISGTNTPTNYPTKTSSIAIWSEFYERTDLNPLGGEGYSIWTYILRKHITPWKSKEWPARVTSVPYQVQRRVEETSNLIVFITQYLTGYLPRPFTRS